MCTIAILRLSTLFLGSCSDEAGESKTDGEPKEDQNDPHVHEAYRLQYLASSIGLQTLQREFNPNTPYGADTWSMTSISSQRIDAFD